MLDHNKFYALTDTLAANLLQYRLQWNAAVRLKTFDCLHPSDMLSLWMFISNFRRTSNAVCCKVILFPVTALPLSIKRYGRLTQSSP